MNKKSMLSLTALILILIWSCNSNKKTKEIQPGYYQLTKTETTTAGNTIAPQKPGFQSGIIRLTDNDSMEFVGQNTIGDLLWGYSKFGYKIKGKQIILTNGEFKKKITFEITPDNLLKLETNAEGMTNTYFEPLDVKLSGKYRVFSFMKNEHASDSEVITLATDVFNTESFNFISSSNVIIQPKLAQLITGETVSADTVFSYKVIDNEITFSNTSHSVTIPFIFDGIFRLSINNKNIERIDLGEIEG
ncbi:MAG: hypothetical protein JXR61_05600 [Prolixibacteraceae bacterium]|nr:hypothetical protein [Prolixibacteraceae bacterium]